MSSRRSFVAVDLDVCDADMSCRTWCWHVRARLARCLERRHDTAERHPRRAYQERIAGSARLYSRQDQAGASRATSRAGREQRGGEQAIRLLQRRWRTPFKPRPEAG